MRPTTPADAPAISALVYWASVRLSYGTAAQTARFLDDYYSAPAVRASMGGGVMWLVAENLSGTLEGVSNLDPGAGGMGGLHVMRPRRGTGLALTLARLELARVLGLARLEMSIHDGNHPMLALAAGLGFEYDRDDLDAEHFPRSRFLVLGREL